MMLILNGVESGQHLRDEQCLPSTLGRFLIITTWSRSRMLRLLPATVPPEWPDTSDRTRPARQAGTRLTYRPTRLTYPGGMEGWVGPGGWVRYVTRRFVNLSAVIVIPIQVTVPCSVEQLRCHWFLHMTGAVSSIMYLYSYSWGDGPCVLPTYVSVILAARNVDICSTVQVF